MIDCYIWKKILYKTKILSKGKLYINNHGLNISHRKGENWFYNFILNPKNFIFIGLHGDSMFDCILLGLNFTLYSGMPFLIIFRNL